MKHSNELLMDNRDAVRCEICPRHCELLEGQVGYCKARHIISRENKPLYYGSVSSCALDPIEKKPLYHFHPEKMILSVGSLGCNMRCYFCQNHEISQIDGERQCIEKTPEELVLTAKESIPAGNIGIAFTYNEPSVCWEFVRDTAILAKEENLCTVMVTNGCFCDTVSDELLPVIDAFNIDLKCFTNEGYAKLGGDLATVKNSITRAVASSHVEVTTLVVPGFNDDEAKMREQVEWLASLSSYIPFHISRYFPSWKADMSPTSEKLLEKFANIAKEHLKYVYLGNMSKRFL